MDFCFLNSPVLFSPCAFGLKTRRGDHPPVFYQNSSNHELQIASYESRITSHSLTFSLCVLCIPMLFIGTLPATSYAQYLTLSLSHFARSLRPPWRITPLLSHCSYHPRATSHELSAMSYSLINPVHRRSAGASLHVIFRQSGETTITYYLKNLFIILLNTSSAIIGNAIFKIVPNIFYLLSYFRSHFICLFYLSFRS